MYTLSITDQGFAGTKREGMPSLALPPIMPTSSVVHIAASMSFRSTWGLLSIADQGQTAILEGKDDVRPKQEDPTQH